jgi:hypothetical protein
VFELSLCLFHASFILTLIALCNDPHLYPQGNWASG